MQFINPVLLWWALPFGAVPIIIYYLMRYRSLKVTWGANYVLERALERLRRKLYLDQIILLALRALACIALIVAFARPALQGRGGTMAAGAGHNIVILDGSYSMLAGENNRQRWDAALESLENTFNAWGRGQRWSLLLLAEEPQWIVEAGTFTTTGAAMEVVSKLAVMETSASLLAAFEAVNGRYPTGELAVYLFADDTVQSWQGMEAATWPTQRNVPVYWFNPPLTDRHNLALTAVQPASDRAVAGHPHPIFVSVQNFSPQPVEDVPLELLVDGTYFSRQTVSILSGQQRRVQFDVLFSNPGSHHVTARLAKDALEFDNTLSAGVDVVAELNVFVLRDRGAKGAFDSAWTFLEIVARARNISGRRDPRVLNMGPLTFHDVDPQSLEESKLQAADVVFIDGGVKLNASLVSAIRRYVNSGGALVLAADERIDADAWNSLLGNAGLLPAKLRNLQTHPLGGEKWQTLLAAEFVSPALRMFENVDYGNIGNAKFFTWHQLAQPAENAVVLAQFADFTPFAVRSRAGLGNVTLLAAGLNSRNNNLMVREFTVPLIVRLFTDAATSAAFPRTVRLNQSVRLRLDDTETYRAITFAGEGLFPTPPTPVAATTRADATIVEVPAELAGTGLYHLTFFRRDDERTRVWFGVQGPRSDSDLTPIDAGRRQLIAESTGVVEAGTWEQFLELLTAEGFGAEWQHWVYVAMICFLIGELIMERRFV